MRVSALNFLNSLFSLHSYTRNYIYEIAIESGFQVQVSNPIEPLLHYF